MLLDVRQGLLLMVYLTFKYSDAITCVWVIPFEIPCESHTQNADRRRLKNWDAPWDKGKNNYCLGGFR